MCRGQGYSEELGAGGRGQGWGLPVQVASHKKGCGPVFNSHCLAPMGSRSVSRSWLGIPPLSKIRGH
jgi:hypothetical protein